MTVDKLKFGKVVKVLRPIDVCLECPVVLSNSFIHRTSGRSDSKRAYVDYAFTREPESELNISILSQESSISLVWTGNSGFSFHVIPHQRGAFGFRLERKRVVEVAGGDSFDSSSGPRKYQSDNILGR